MLLENNSQIGESRIQWKISSISFIICQSPKMWSILFLIQKELSMCLLMNTKIIKKYQAILKI